MKNSAICLLSALLISNFAHAGNEGGHGGGGIVCSNPDGSLQSVQLFDLWEKRNANDGSTLTPKTTTEEAQLESALVKFSAVAPDDVLKMRAVLAGLNIQSVGGTEQLVPPRDTGLLSMRQLRPCSLQGVAEFNDENEVLTIDAELFAAMSTTDRAALKFHELLYKVWRRRPVIATDSLMVRKTTGAVFADQPLNFVRADATRTRASFECDAGAQFSFLVVEVAGGSLELHFTRYAGRDMIGKMVAPVQYNARVHGWASRITDLPESENVARVDFENVSTRFKDGFRHQTIPARRGQSNPAFYPSFDFHYGVAMKGYSEYEPSVHFTIQGGDSFTTSKNSEITINSHTQILALTPGGFIANFNSVLSCRKL